MVFHVVPVDIINRSANSITDSNSPVYQLASTFAGIGKLSSYQDSM
jgi:hypothetical protein